MVVVIGLVSTFLGGSTAFASDPPEAIPIAVDDGDVRTIQVGSIVGQATLQDSECVIGTVISVGGTIPSGASPMEVVWELDEDCSVVITEIRRAGVTDDAAPSGQHANPDPISDASLSPSFAVYNLINSNNHTGWVKYTILEQFDVTATEVYARLTYTKYHGSVGDGRSPYAYCDHSDFPGWTIESCTSSYYPHGPDEVWIDVTGEFNHTLNIEYTQYAKWWATPSEHEFRCELTEGSLPIFWRESCAGG